MNIGDTVRFLVSDRFETGTIVKISGDLISINAWVLNCCNYTSIIHKNHVIGIDSECVLVLDRYEGTILHPVYIERGPTFKQFFLPVSDISMKMDCNKGWIVRGKSHKGYIHYYKETEVNFDWNKIKII